jgi:malonyl CoA-acyl carrier protein transacylase
MNKIVTLSRLMCLTTALAGLALMATPDIANAKRFGQHGGSSHVRQGNSHPANITKRNGIRPGFVISGQPANVKRVLRHRKEKSHQGHCRTNYNGIRPQFVISGQPADCKRVLRHRKEKSHEAHCRTNYKGIRPHFVISGQPADCKRVLRHRREKS